MGLTEAWNSNSRGSSAFFWTLGTCTYMSAFTDVPAHTYIFFSNFKKMFFPLKTNNFAESGEGAVDRAQGLSVRYESLRLRVQILAAM